MQRSEPQIVRDRFRLTVEVDDVLGHIIPHLDGHHVHFDCISVNCEIDMQLGAILQRDYYKPGSRRSASPHQCLPIEIVVTLIHAIPLEAGWTYWRAVRCFVGVGCETFRCRVASPQLHKWRTSMNESISARRLGKTGHKGTGPFAGKSTMLPDHQGAGIRRTANLTCRQRR